MFNLALYKREMIRSWKMLAIFSVVLAMYFSIIVTMFDPELGSALNEFAQAMPELMAMVGMNPSDSSLTSFMAAYLYGFIMLVFPMVFSILSANRLIAQQVDKGSMVYLLAAPVKRKDVAFTQMKVQVSGIFFLVAFATALGIIVCEMLFPHELEIGKFILLNVGVFSLQLFIGGICFLSSCIFNESKHSIAVGAGIPALAFIIQMVAQAGAKLEYAKYATFFTLFDSKGIIAGDAIPLWNILILFLGALLLFGSAITVFSKKDLHI